MKKLYLECNMGAAGDMLMGALLELLPDKNLFFQRMRGLGLPDVSIDAEAVTKCGIQGTKMRIRIGGEEEIHADDYYKNNPDAHTHSHEHLHDPEHDQEHEIEPEHAHPHEHEHGHEHAHFSYDDICGIIRGLDLAENVREHALEVYRLIAEAEASVHGTTLEEIHFHEVGSFDAVVDVVGCSLLFHMLGVDEIDASPVHVGSGFVRCAHGTLPVPTPATARILQGVPIYGGKIKGELCTPTGAALLKHFVRRFGDMEPMAVTGIGYGMGSKDFEAANCVRAFLSNTPASPDAVVEIRCNLDDMTPEAIGFAAELLLEQGALDVFTTPIFMKKNRPAVLFTCLCRPEDRSELARLIFEHTTTLGIRYQNMKRDVLDYTTYPVTTPFGDVRIKSAAGYGVVKEKPEYEDVRAAALRCGVPFSAVYAAAVAAINSANN